MNVYISLLLASMGLFLVWGMLLTTRLKSFTLLNRLATAMVGISFLWQIRALLSHIVYNVPLNLDMLGWWILKDIGIVLWAGNLFYTTLIRDREICLNGVAHNGH